MTENTIDKYLTPTSRGNKRVRSYSSPSSEEDRVSCAMGGNDRVGDLTQDQLFASLGRLLDSKFDEKLANVATKDDLLVLTGKVELLTEENRLLKEEVRSLRESEKVVGAKLLDLEGRSRRNNLIFKGLKWAGKWPDFREVVRRFCVEVLGSRENIYINRAHPLGKDGKNVIAHIPDDGDIEYLMMQTKRLRDTGYVVHRDFPYEVRVKRAKLAAVRKEVERVTEGKAGRMPIVFDHLTVKGCRFTWFDGVLMAGQRPGAEKLQELLKHDFTVFLQTLKTGNPGLGQRRPLSPAESMDTSSSEKNPTTKG